MNEENKKTMKPTFEEVIRMDENLRYLATYEVTKGRMVVPKGVEEMMELSNKVAQQFNYFKKQIHDGECSYEFIKTTVLAKNGAYPQSKKKLDFSDPKCFLEDDALEIMNPPSDPKEAMQTFVEKLVGSLFPGARLEKIEYTGEQPQQTDNPVVTQDSQSIDRPTDSPPQPRPKPKAKKNTKSKKRKSR